MNTDSDSSQPQQRPSVAAGADEFLGSFASPDDQGSALRCVIDHMLGLVGVLDLRGTLVDVNTTALDLGGVSREDVVGRLFWDTHWFNHTQQTISRLQRAIAAAVGGQTVRYDETIRAKGDQLLTIDLCITPVKDSAGAVRMLISSGVDVTDREVAIERYKNSEERLRLAAEATGFGTYDYDPISQQLFWSPETKRLCGVPESTRPTFQLMENLVHPTDKDRYKQVVQRSLDPAGNGRHELEFRISRPDGSVRFLRDVGKTFFKGVGGTRRAVRIVGTIEDVTDRKRAEDSITESENRFRLLADHMSQFAWIADNNGDIYWFNKRWFEYTGSTLEDMKGWGWTSSHHPDHLDRVVRKFRRSVLQTGEEWEDTFPLRGKDGFYRWFLSRAIPIRNVSGEIMQWFGTNTDVTELREIEQELRLAQSKAEQASQAKTNFLANMSHEIRSPMTAIMGYLDLLTIESEEDKERIEIIKRNSNFLLTLINDILDLSKIEAGRLSLDPITCSPATLTAEIIRLMRVPAEEKPIELTHEFVTPIPEQIEIDAIRLRQILVNLVGNAIKFTQKGSVRVAVSFDRRYRHLNWEVIDTGIGIDFEQQQRVFQAFEQADASIVRKYGGSGLGLAISVRLAKLFGGNISIASTPGIGSCFRLTLPIAGNVHLESPTGSTNDSGRSGATPATPAPETDKDLQGVRVLVVDDRADIRFLIRHLIQKAGGNVVCCENGAEAVDAIRDNEHTREAFDALVMDMQMPVMDGLTAIATLRGSGCTIPAIALTANAMQTDRDRCLKAGFNHYLSKPIEADRLRATLREIIGRT